MGVIRQSNKPNLAKIMQTMKKAKMKPLEPYKTALTKWKCLHIPCGNIVYPKYNSIQQGQGGCGTCRYIKSGNSNRMPEKEAVAFMLKAGFKPLEPYKNSTTKWKSKCKTCKSIVFPVFSDVRGGHGCLNCSWKSNADKNRKDEKVAIKVMLDHGYQPIEPYKHSNARWKCKCLKCGKIIYPTFGTVQYMDSQCEYCAGNKVDPKDAKKIMIASKLKPLEPYIDSKKPWKCLHIPCGRVVSPSYGAVRSGQGGCRFCATHGINLNVSSYLYLITHSQLGAHKVGIGNSRDASRKYMDRLGKFRKFGWESHKVWDFETGEEALKVEAAVFQVIRKEWKLPSYLSREQMPKTGGETETVDANEITLLQLEKIIKKVIKGLQE